MALRAGFRANIGAVFQAEKFLLNCLPDGAVEGAHEVGGRLPRGVGQLEESVFQWTGVKEKHH